MKIESKSMLYYLAALVPLPVIITPLLARMDPQVIFGLSNYFWSGFVCASSIVGMIILLAVSSSNQKPTKP